ncbi:hypothetical protein PINS_up013778 [Pythium insidiosum]|nr:hypothetical protein PINS_up013778 [Pythium insidiosum]
MTQKEKKNRSAWNATTVVADAHAKPIARLQFSLDGQWLVSAGAPHSAMDA